MPYKLNAQLTISDKNHDRLINYLTALLEASGTVRDAQVEKFREIDQEVYGFIVPDEADKKRMQDNRQGKGVKPVEEKLPLTLTRLEEALTYLLLVLAPDEGMYSAIAHAEEQNIAKAFAARMNEHAEYFGHYHQLGMFLFNALKYNYAGCLCEWVQVRGNRLANGDGGTLVIHPNEVVEEGNQLTATDPYNTFYDTAVSPLKVHRDGEFVAFVDVKRDFWLYRAESNGEIFNVEKAKLKLQGAPSLQYYRNRPRIRYNENISEVINWADWLTLKSEYPDGTAPFVNEIVTKYIQLYPNKWGLGPSDKLEVWRFTFTPKGTILEGQQQANAHGLIPHVVAMPNEDGFMWNTKSWAEHLTPFNRFSSFLVNTHIHSTRRALNGLIFYDRKLFGDLSQYDGISGRIPTETSAEGVDFRQRILSINDAPDTQYTLRDLQVMIELMEDVLPTTMQRQVASLDRATQYQAAATVQASSRRNLKIGKTIYLQALVPLNHMQMYNMLQYQQEIEVITKEGELVTADPQQFREQKLQFVISEGLRGLDKLTFIINIKEVLAMILQNQQAAAAFDIPEIINHWTTLIGDNTDFSQFRIKSAFDALTPQEKDVAYQLLQQANQPAGEGALPAPGPGAAQ